MRAVAQEKWYMLAWEQVHGGRDAAAQGRKGGTTVAAVDSQADFGLGQGKAKSDSPMLH